MKRIWLVFVTLVLVIESLVAIPRASAAALSFTSVSSQSATTLALDNEGFIWAWGKNLHGQFGNGITTDSEVPLRMEVVDSNTLVRFREVKTGLNHSMALDTNGQIWTTGNNSDGQLGHGDFNPSLSWGKLDVKDGGAQVTFSSIATGRGASYAIDEEGELWGWGFRISEKIQGATSRPVKLDLTDGGSAVKFKSIAANEEQAVGIDSNNHLWQVILSGGQTSTFNLIDGGAIPQFREVAVGAGYGTGDFLALALETDGNIWIWGSNNNGQQGDGGVDPQTRWSPEKLNILDGGTPVVFSKISGGNHYALALDTNGNLWAWGKNDFGQLGNGTTINSAPIKVEAIENGSPIIFTTITAGYEQSYALDTEGRIWAWGYSQGLVPNRMHLNNIPTVTVGVSKPSSKYLEGITLTANVSGSLGDPTGIVEFRDDGNLLGSRTLNGGSATFDTNSLSPGRHSLSVHYGGDDTYQAGVSETLVYTVHVREAPILKLIPSTTSDTYSPVTVEVYVQLDGNDNGLNRLKWLYGDRKITDFAGAGTDILDTQRFEAAISGMYTVYARDEAGGEAIKTIELNNIRNAGDPSGLLGTINMARQALTDHPEGTGLSDASAATRAQLLIALDIAQTIADDAANRTQEELESARSDLDQAIATFRSKVIGLVLTAPDEGVYGTNSTLRFILTYSDSIDVTGMPQLGIKLGGETVYAVYTGRIGGSQTALQFDYVVPTGLSIPEGIQLQEELLLPNGAAIVYTDTGESARTKFVVPDMSQIRIISVEPSLELGTSGGNGTAIQIAVTAITEQSEMGNVLTHLRWLKGRRTSADFLGGTSGADLLAMRTFTVKENGEYTIYAKDTAGNEAVHAITISTIVKPINPSPVKSRDERKEVVKIQNQSALYELKLTSGVDTLKFKWTEQDLNASIYEIDGHSLNSDTDAAWILTLPKETISKMNPENMLHVRTRLSDILIPVVLLRELDDQPYSEVRVVLSGASLADRNSLQEAAAKLGADVHGWPLQLKISAVIDGNERSLQNFGYPVSLMIPRSALMEQGQQFVARYDQVQKSLSFVPSALNEHNRRWQTKSGGVYALLTNDKRFDDMQGSWAEDDVHRLASLLIVNGVDGKNFGPKTSVTRAELTAMVVRSLGLPSIATDQASFDDVNMDRWYAGSLTVALREELVQGNDDGRFYPDKPISRQEAAVVMLRALKWAGYAVDEGKEDTISSFTDAHNIAPWARSALADAVSEGFLQGYPEGDLQPESNISRAEAAVMLVQLLEHTKVF